MGSYNYIPSDEYEHDAMASEAAFAERSHRQRMRLAPGHPDEDDDDVEHDYDGV